MTVKIVTDSTADLPPGLAEELNISVVPLKVYFGEEEFLDWIDLDSDNFLEKLAGSEVMPHTSQPSPADFVKIYREIAAESDQLISVHLSAKLSGTYQSAVIAKSELKHLDIEVIDSGLASMALGIVVIEAARAAKAGLAKEDIILQLKDNMAKVKVYFAVDTLEYLQRNGRIGKAAALVGGLLNVKPLLTLSDGVVAPKEKVRGKAKAQERLIDIIGEEFGEEVRGKAVVLHGSELNRALLLKEKLESRYKFSEIFISSIGAVIGTHTGPGVLAVGVLPE
ncbi:MAG: DegV family protein [Bacillota bacterium]|nr:DegV family protein [Bacillota bacterium]HHU30255.1 DegV family protein [Bacillota bacterium]